MTDEAPVFTAAEVAAQEAIAQRAIEGILTRLGVDTSNPLSAQKDFAKLRAMRELLDDEDFQADLAFMRKWRLNADKVTDTSIKTVVRFLVAGGLGLFLAATKDWWLKHITG